MNRLGVSVEGYGSISQTASNFLQKFLMTKKTNLSAERIQENTEGE